MDSPQKGIIETMRMLNFPRKKAREMRIFGGNADSLRELESSKCRGQREQPKGREQPEFIHSGVQVREVSCKEAVVTNVIYF